MFKKIVHKVSANENKFCFDYKVNEKKSTKKTFKLVKAFH